MTGRFAPSPTGRMHLGNLWSALLNWLTVRKAGGRLLLRIEDIDAGRCRPHFARQLMADLRLMGLDWDEDADTPVTYQQQRLDLYATLLDQFTREGYVYPCVCSRAELHAASAPHAEDGHIPYAGTCRQEANRLGRNPGKPPAWRLRVPEGSAATDRFTDRLQGLQQMDLSREWGDFVIRRADGQFAYQFVCAVDDALTGVDFVLRGADLLPSTFPQRYIFRLLQKTPPEYCHVPLLQDVDGVRLSKRQASLDLGAMLASGWRPADILGSLAHLAGWLDQPAPVTAKELLATASCTPDTLAGCREIAIRPEHYLHPPA